MGGVDVVRDGDKPDAIGREHPAEIPACLNILPPQPGQVLDNDAVDFSVCNVLHHLFERRTVKEDTAVPIVDFLRYNFDFRIFLNEILDQSALVGYAVALAAVIVGVREPDLCGCFVFRHKNAPFCGV